jgi:hypothetical protein
MQHKKNMGKKFIRLSFCRVLYEEFSSEEFFANPHTRNRRKNFNSMQILCVENLLEKKSENPNGGN